MALGRVLPTADVVFREGASWPCRTRVGVVGSVAAARLLSTLLYGIDPTDGVSFGLGSGLLMLVAAAATYLPARRAARLDPTVALRAD